MATGGGAAEGCRLYLITPARIEAAAFAETLAAALDAGDVACVQLRLPETASAARIAAAEVLRPVCHARGVALVIDEDPAAARAAQSTVLHQAQASALRLARWFGGEAPADSRSVFVTSRPQEPVLSLPRLSDEAMHELREGLDALQPSQTTARIAESFAAMATLLKKQNPIAWACSA